MSTFLCPIDDTDNIYIKSVNASSFTEARDKVEEEIREEYEDIRITGTWNDFLIAASEKDIYIGNIYDRDQF